MKLLFVCLGNICRSPMAEAVMVDLVAKASLASKIHVSSRATGRYNEGNPPHRGTQKILKKAGISWQGIYATQIKPADFYEYDLILAMDQQNMADLQAVAPTGTADKIKLFLSVLPEGSLREVPDPYYTGNFEQTYQLVTVAAAHWLEHLKARI